jgi:hypothetical protein
VSTYEDYSGLIFKYTNVSANLTAAPVLRVNFVKGSVVTGDNVNGDIPDIAPGQSAYGDVGAVGDSGQRLKFSSCDPVSYTLDNETGGTYAP